MTFNALVDQTANTFKTFSTFIHDDYRGDMIKLIEAQADYAKSLYKFNTALLEKNQSFFELSNLLKK